MTAIRKFPPPYPSQQFSLGLLLFSPVPYRAYFCLFSCFLSLVIFAVHESLRIWRSPFISKHLSLLNYSSWLSNFRILMLRMTTREQAFSKVSFQWKFCKLFFIAAMSWSPETLTLSCKFLHNLSAFDEYCPNTTLLPGLLYRGSCSENRKYVGSTRRRIIAIIL